MASPKNWNRICISAGIAAILGLSSCTKVYIEKPIDKQIVVVSSTIGPGDNGYYDLIIKGLTGVYMDHSVACMNYLIPETLEQAESLIYKWIEKSGREAAQTLLVLPASEFRDITENTTSSSLLWAAPIWGFSVICARIRMAHGAQVWI